MRIVRIVHFLLSALACIPRFAWDAHQLARRRRSALLFAQRACMHSSLRSGCALACVLLALGIVHVFVNRGRATHRDPKGDAPASRTPQYTRTSGGLVVAWVTDQGIDPILYRDRSTLTARAFGGCRIDAVTRDSSHNQTTCGQPRLGCSASWRVALRIENDRTIGVRPTCMNRAMGVTRRALRSGWIVRLGLGE